MVWVEAMLIAGRSGAAGGVTIVPPAVAVSLTVLPRSVLVGVVSKSGRRQGLVVRVWTDLRSGLLPRR